jgi:hypothetical protein
VKQIEARRSERPGDDEDKRDPTPADHRSGLPKIAAFRKGNARLSA